MQDTIKVEIPLKHRPFGDRMVFPDGKSEEYRARTRVKGEHSWSSIHLRSLAGGRKLLLEGSPATYLQGHNAFGSNAVYSLTYQCARRALEAINVSVDAAALAGAIRKGRILRLDLACSLKLPPNTPVGKVITELQVALVSCGNDVDTYGDETAAMPRKYAPRISFYDKQKLIKKWLARRWREERFDGRDYLLEALDGVVRVEVSFKGRWLKDRGLHRVQDWSVERARAMLDEQVETAFKRGNLVLYDWPAVYLEIQSSEVRTTYALWLAGFDLSLHKKPRALAAHRQALLAHGVDIKKPAPELHPTRMRFSELLLKSKRCYGFPGEARRRGLVALTDQRAA